MTTPVLKAPFPYFGGKRRVASLVWDRLGDCANFIEPFCGSAALLLGRPTPPRIETLNDADCFVANFWRATQHDPEAVAAFADGPVNEADLHARHRWLVTSDAAAEFRRRMRTDPDYHDAKVAGWWCWGLCCWIGSGWCVNAESQKMPRLASHERRGGEGVHNENMPGSSPVAKRPQLHTGNSEHGRGVHGEAKGLHEKRPAIGGKSRYDEGPKYGQGVHAKGPPDAHRPQLADAFGPGRGVHAGSGGMSQQMPHLGGGNLGSVVGVHANPSAGTCAARRAWLVDWFGRLRDRLRTVRVCCGDWLRVCDSPSVTTRLGTTGIFLDPPYSDEAGRTADLYGVDCGRVAHAVRAYCLGRGADPQMRIVLAGYAGEGHEALEDAGWGVIAWRAAGGYGNRSAKGKANAGRERLWVSPHCEDPDASAGPLFRTGGDE